MGLLVFIVIIVPLCVGIVGGIVLETKPYRERKQAEREWQEQAQALERQRQVQARIEQAQRQEQIERYKNTLNDLYYQLDLLVKLERKQNIDTNSKFVTELQIKKQIATQRQIYNVRKQIEKVESAIANLQAS